MKLVLNPDRFFDPEPSVRKLARELYEEVKDLPLVCPHGHVEPELLSQNKPFPNPAELFLTPDHYLFRMMYSQGISMESLGIPMKDGSRSETSGLKIWKKFAKNFHLFVGTPSALWLNQELAEVFGIDEKLDQDSSTRIYDKIQEKLQSAEFLPRALFDRFNIEVLSTTDPADADLNHHKNIRDSGWKGRVIPCFRPDGVVDIMRADWRQNIKALGRVCGYEIGSYKKYIQALQDRRNFFKEMGCVSTDQGVVTPYTQELAVDKAEAIFQRALNGDVSQEDSRLFSAQMLMEMARMSLEDGLVMQIHAGSFRNHNQTVFERFGLDKGADIPLQTEYTRNLHALLNKYGNELGFTLVLFTLDESTYTRELAPLAGHYPAVKLGPPWWFHDSIEGMTRFRQSVIETAGIYNTVGFNDDTRAFLSIPARHDMSRRIDCNFLGRLLARHIVDIQEARGMARSLAYELAKKTYKLG